MLQISNPFYILIILILSSCCTSKKTSVISFDGSKSFDKYRSSLKPGSTLVLQEGIYNMSFINTIPSGTKDKPVTIKAAENATVVIQPKRGTHVFLFDKHKNGTFASFINLKGLTIDGQFLKHDGIKFTRGAYNINIEDCEIINCTNQAILISEESHHINILHSNIHHNGLSDFNHGIYISGGNNKVVNSKIHHNAGWGIHVYGGGDKNNFNLLEGNEVYDNGQNSNRAEGIVVAAGRGHVVKNNLVYGNIKGVSIYNTRDVVVIGNTVKNNKSLGLYFGDKAINCRAENNTLEENGGDGLRLENPINLQEVKNKVKNNNRKK